MDLFSYIKDKALKASQFIQQNPTPMGFANRQFQERVAQPIARAVPDIGKIMQKINIPEVSLPKTQAVPGGNPVETILKSSFPILQAPEQANAFAQSYGRTLSEPQKHPVETAMNLVPLFMGGVKAIKPVRAIDDILSGTNQPVKTLIKYSRPAAAAPIDFIADEAGNVSKVKQLGQKATEVLKTVFRGEGNGKALPAPVERPLLPAAGEATLANPVTRDLLAARKTVEDFAASVPKAIFPKKNTATKVANAVIGDTSLRGGRGVIANDSPAGKVIVNTLDLAEKKVAQLAGNSKARLYTALQRLTDSELGTFADVVEGKAKPVSAAQVNAVNTWRAIAKEVHDLATETGMKIGKIESYFPHFTIQDGKKALEETQFIDRGANMGYGNLTKSRTGAAEFSKNPNVLFDYLDHAYNSIVRESLFGRGDKNLYTLAGKTANPSQVSSMLDSMLGKGNTGGLGQKVAEGITNFETTTKMGFMSPFTNLTQQLSAISRTDVPTAIKTYGRMISNPEQTVLNAIKANEIDPQAGGKLLAKMDELQGSSMGRKWLELIRFNLAEKTNRIFSVNAGMEYVQKMAQQAKTGSQAAVRELQRLGIKTFNLTEQDIIDAGRKVSLETQFSTKRGELPSGWETSAGRVATQFKGFAYKQTGFIKNQAVRLAQEAGNGNLKPLLTALTTFGVGAPIIGEINNDIRSLITNKKRDDSGLERYINNVLAASSFGLLDNVSGLLGQYGESGVVGSIAGPAASDALKIATGVSDASKGVSGYDTEKSAVENLDPNRTTRRTALGFIPGVGKTISNTVVPNSYVENYVGPNVGLNEKDKQTYNNMKTTGNNAELFKEKQQKTRDTQPSFLDKITGKKQPLVIPSDTATYQEKKDFNTQVNNMLDAGGVPSKKQLSQRFFKGKSATSPLLEERMKSYGAIKTVLDGDYSEEQKQAILEASGASRDNVDYYVRASKDSDVKMQEILPLVQGESDPQKRLSMLAQMRKMVGGKQILSSEMITYLYENDYVSESEKKMLSALQYDEVNDKFYFNKSYTSGKKLTYAQAKAIFKPIDISKIIKTGGTQTANRDDKLIEGIFTRKPKRSNL